MFQSTPSGGKATAGDLRRSSRLAVSIHAFRGEGDSQVADDDVLALLFQSTPSGGKATAATCRRAGRARQFQSTPSGGKATLHGLQARTSRWVSIHAFRGEGDQAGVYWLIRQRFQSTPSGGKATLLLLKNDANQVEFQSTPSGGKATSVCDLSAPVWDVSIHAFRGEGDDSVPGALMGTVVFQSTPSGGKATVIHADHTPLLSSFNPRLPGGRRPASSRRCLHPDRFNPRLPGGRRPGLSTLISEAAGVSIHAFRGEGDTGMLTTSISRRVSIHAFRGEGDKIYGRMIQFLDVSIHAFRGEGDAFIAGDRRSP